MFNFYSLSSSSSGNCLLIRSDNANILIDVGISMKKINNELEKINLSLKDITAILITHEHIDHCKALATINRKYNIPIYTNKDTWYALNNIYDSINETSKNFISFDTNFNIGDLTIKAFSTSHDCANSSGYCIFKNNKKMCIATDMGYIDNNVFNMLSNSNFTFLESNYDTNMLDVGNYPYSLKKRISSNIGHLSNSQCSDAIARLYKTNSNNFMLGHLSRENNFPELALQTVYDTLNKENINLNDITINIAEKDCLSNIICLEN